MAGLNFDASQVAPDMGMDPIPPGWQKVMVDESEIKPTKAPGGAYLKVRVTVLEGKYANRKVFVNYNIQNANPVAQEIGFKQLSALAHAVGVLQVADSQQLHNIPFYAKIKIRQPEEGSTYEPQNEISGYKHLNDPPDTAVAASGPAGAPAGVKPPPAPGPAPQPWQQGYTAPAAPAAAAPPPPAPPPPPAAPPAPPAVQRPTDPSHIHAPGTPGEQWWIDGAWRPAVVAAPPAPPGPPAAPGAWTPPAGGQPWQHTPPAAGAPAAPAAPAQPPHAAQSELPPWQRPAA